MKIGHINCITRTLIVFRWNLIYIAFFCSSISLQFRLDLFSILIGQAHKREKRLTAAANKKKSLGLFFFLHWQKKRNTIYAMFTLWCQYDIGRTRQLHQQHTKKVVKYLLAHSVYVIHGDENQRIARESESLNVVPLWPKQIRKLDITVCTACARKRTIEWVSERTNECAILPSKWI